MQQPPGFVPKGESHKVCLLRKSIYILRQSHRAWFEKFSNLLLDYGITRTMSEYSVLLKLLLLVELFLWYMQMI